MALRTCAAALMAAPLLAVSASAGEVSLMVPFDYVTERRVYCEAERMQVFGNLIVIEDAEQNVVARFYRQVDPSGYAEQSTFVLEERVAPCRIETSDGLYANEGDP